MQKLIYNIELDTKIYKPQNDIILKQYDIDSALFIIKIVEGDRTYPLSGSSVEIIFTKPDGTYTMKTQLEENSPLTIVQNNIHCLVPQSALTVIGTVNCEVTIRGEEGEKLTTRRFGFYVDSILLTESLVLSDNNVHVLDGLISQVNGLLAEYDVITQAEAVRLDAEGVRSSNEIARETLRGELLTLKLALEGLQTTLSSLEVTVSDNEDLRVTDEGVRKDNEVLRIQLYNDLLTLQTQLNTLKTETTTAKADTIVATTNANNAANAANSTNDVIVTAEGLRVTAEGLRVTADNLRTTAEQARVTSFNNALSTFNTNSQTAIDDLIAETNLVESQYPVRLTAVENDLVAHKEDYMRLNIGNRLTNLEEAKIKKYNVRRVLGATTPVLERLGDAVGKVANADTDLTKHNVVQNDFDSIYPWSHMRKCIIDSTGRITYEGEAGYTTAIGDWMIEIPEFYWKRTNDGVILEEWVSPYPVGGYIKSNKFYIARFKTSEVDNIHVSRPNSFPKVVLGREGFRAKAIEKGAGWQLEDLLGNYIINLLYRVEFAHLDSQLILGNGVTSTRYTEDDISQLAETSVNRVVLLNANANNYNIGETISLGTSRGNFAGFQYRVITAINIVDATTKEIVFDGDPINTLTTYKVYQIGQKSGKTLHLLSSSGTAIGARNRSSITYRGIEDVFGNVWEWIDGVLINDHRGYVCLDPAKYADTLTANYQPLSYENAKSNSYAGELGFDSNYPFAEFTVDVTGGSTTKYCDYYYQNTGLRAPFVGGAFSGGVLAGLRFWDLGGSPGLAYFHFGSQLLRRTVL